MVLYHSSAMQYQIYRGRSQAARCGSCGQQSAARTYLLFVVVGNCLFTNTDTALLHACTRVFENYDPYHLHASNTLEGNVCNTFVTFYGIFCPHTSVQMTLLAADRAVLSCAVQQYEEVFRWKL